MDPYLHLRNHWLGGGEVRTERSLELKFRALGRLVGNTPMLGVHVECRGNRGVIYAKCEQLNFTGSIKDRIALYLLRKAYSCGEIHPGDTIVEAASGNTGISFAAFGSALGHPVKIFMPDWMSRERMDLIRSYGAEVITVSSEQGGFLGSIRMAEAFAAGRHDVFLPRQFSNDETPQLTASQPDQRFGHSWRRQDSTRTPS